MARKSRSVKPEQKEERPCRALLYARLSVEDNGITGGDGLEVQVALLRRYAAVNGWTEGGIYRDNGVSGTHFRRPGFTAMMAALEQGGGQCVVVKDLSRLGRDWIETGRLLEEVFPALGVRVCTVDEGNENDMLDRALRSISHDFYARDLGEKISASIGARRKNGAFWGKAVPFGYRKSGEKHGLIPSGEEAEQVRALFFRCAAGEEMEGKREKTILTDPVYAGYVPLQKNLPPAYRGDRYHPIPPEERVYVPGQVPALVSAELFGVVWRKFYPHAAGPFPWEIV